LSNTLLGDIQISSSNDGGDGGEDDQLRRRMIIITPEKVEEPIIRRKLVLTDGFSPLPDPILPDNNNNNNNNNQKDGLPIVLEQQQEQQQNIQKRRIILKSKPLKEVIDKYNAMKAFDSLYRRYAKSPSIFFSLHKSDFAGKPKRRIFSVFRKEYKSTVMKC